MSKSEEVSVFPDTMTVAQAIPGLLRVKERRLHKRYTSSPMKLTFLGAEHEPINWSLGGFLIADCHPHTPIRTITEGFLDIFGQPGRFAICVELVRRDKRTKEIAFRFVQPSAALLNALSRIMAELTDDPEATRIMLKLAAAYEEIARIATAKPNNGATQVVAVHQAKGDRVAPEQIGPPCQAHDRPRQIRHRAQGDDV